MYLCAPFVLSKLCTSSHKKPSPADICNGDEISSLRNELLIDILFRLTAELRGLNLVGPDTVYFVAYVTMYKINTKTHLPQRCSRTVLYHWQECNNILREAGNYTLKKRHHKTEDYS